MGELEIIACWYQGGELRQLPIMLDEGCTLGDAKVAIARNAGFLVRYITLSLGLPPRYSLEDFDQTMSADCVLTQHCNITVTKVEPPEGVSKEVNAITSHDDYYELEKSWDVHLQNDWKYDSGKVENLLEDVKVVKEFLTQEESLKFIDLTEKLGFGSLGYTSSYRSNTRIVVKDPKLAEAMLERVRHYVPAVMQSADGDYWDLYGMNECFRFCKYVEGQFFKRHCDSSFARSDNEESFFTLNMYLNGGFKGGNTRFFTSETESERVTFSVVPETGLALFFDHKTKDYVHDGDTVYGDVPKYLMRSDVMYKRRLRTMN
jgi:prolyl 4-hydroxylase